MGKNASGPALTLATVPPEDDDGHVRKRNPFFGGDALLTGRRFLARNPDLHEKYTYFPLQRPSPEISS